MRDLLLVTVVFGLLPWAFSGHILDYMSIPG